MSSIVFTSGEFQTRVSSRKNEFGEWTVRVYRAGYQMKDSVYYTNDKLDAIETAKSIIKFMTKGKDNE